MKKVLALSTALFLLLGAPVFAASPAKEKDPKNKEIVKPKKVKKEKAKASRTIPTQPAPPAPAPTPAPAPAPAPAQEQHGKKKGWNKNPHNPHHPQTTNPGHAKKHVR